MHICRIEGLVFGALLLFSTGCADKHETHLLGSLAYEGSDAEVLVSIPADADPQVGKCAGESSNLDAKGRGIKTSGEITPPYFVGLWPAPGPKMAEIHGRIDVPSVGRPLPGDNPFLKFAVCTIGIDISYDWALPEQLNGDYYVGAWFDKDMNGYPGMDEPLGFYRGDGTSPATLHFGTAKATRVDLVIGTLSTPFASQVDALLINLETSLRKLDFDLFSNQFQPLLFKDPLNRTINEIDALYADLISDTNKAGNKLTWRDDLVPKQLGAVAGSGVLAMSQTKNPAVWDLAQNLDSEIAISLGAGADGIFQISDWKPLKVQSGELKAADAAPTLFAAGTGTDTDLKFEVSFPPSMNFWFGVEQYVPDLAFPATGTWMTLKAMPYLTSGTGGDIAFHVASNNPTVPSTEVKLTSVPLDQTTMIRVTFIPVGGATGYTAWAGETTTATEPDRGNFLRFYVYGAEYIYRKPLPTK